MHIPPRRQPHKHINTWKAALLGLALLPFASRHAQAATNLKREHILLDGGWRFHLGDPLAGANDGRPVPFAWRYFLVPNGQRPASDAFAAPDLQLGDEWKTASPTQDVFSERRGFAWYRTTLPDAPAGKRILHFDAVDDNADVYLNGVKLLHHEGYDESFDVPLVSAWKAGGPNVLAVLVENGAGAGSIGIVGYPQKEAGPDSAFAQPAYSDSGWRGVHLPHDFVVEGAFTPTADAGHGSLPTNVGWYRKTFAVDTNDKGRQLWLDFDGVYRNSYVWLNGKLLGNHKSGYSGFRYDITNAVNYGGENTLAVRADARAQEGWWYEGGGIYRHVWLNKADKTHITPDSVTVTPDVAGKIVTTTGINIGILPPGFKASKYRTVKGKTAVSVKFEVENSSDQNKILRLSADIVAADGTKVGQWAGDETLAPASKKMVSEQISAEDMTLWSLEDPYLYHLVVKVQAGGKLVDSVTVPFGARQIRFDKDKGFFLNGQHVEIQGTCNHQDFAGVGIAMPDSLLDWRVKKLKEMGSNAYRMSHNPPAKELLDACDRQGMLVMDEARHLGDTYRPKTPRSDPASDLSDLKEMVLRDRNHPSIIMWSMCNEEPLQGTPDGARIFSAMKQATLALDPTRPITCAMNGGWGQGITLVEDLQGCNYAPSGYDNFHRNFPDIPMYGSETASAVSTRGEYVNDPVKGYVSAYDVNAPSWAQTAEVAWRAIAERPFVAGGYVWTGFDYKGEPTPYNWPCINSHFGIMDECGFAKDTYYYYLSWWGTQPVAHILPHWNWPGDEGKPKDVWVHSNADRVELFLNGTTLGAKDMPRWGHLQWSVPYAPGKLEAKGYNKSGAQIAYDTVSTTGAATQIRLTPSSKTVLANGEEVVMVEAALLDAEGRVVPYADNQVTFTASGAGQVAGVGNGDASSHEPDRATQRRAFHGLCLAVVQAGEQPGRIMLTATAPGLKSARVTMQAKK